MQFQVCSQMCMDHDNPKMAQMKHAITIALGPVNLLQNPKVNGS